MKPNFRILRLLSLFTLATAGAIPAQDDFPAGARVIAEGLKFPEGPAIGPDGHLYFSDVWGHRLYRWDGSAASVFAEETTGANGLAFDAQGRLFACAGGAGALLQFSSSGEKSTVLAQLDGLPLNQPNDLVIHPSGNLYFTNPGGFSGAKAGHSPVSVVLVRPDASASIVSSGTLAYPNGIGLSPDGKTLYVNDFLGGSTVFKFPVHDDGTLGEASEFVKFGAGGPDGMAVAASGNVYVALNLKAKIVTVSPSGEQLAEIQFPKGSGITNLCFGGPDMKTLFVTVAGKGKVLALDAGEPGLKLVGQK